MSDLNVTAASATLTTTASSIGYGLSLGAVTQTSTTGTTFTIANATPLTIASYTTNSNNSSPKLSFTGTGTATINGNVTQSGSGKLALDRSSGNGTLILQGTSNMTGAVTITAGTIQTAVTTNAFGSTTGINIGGSGVLALRGDGSTAFGNGTTAYPVIVSSTGATINVDQANSAAAGTTLTLGTVVMAGAYTLNTTGANGVSLSLGAISGSTNNDKVINNTIAAPGGLKISSYAEAATSTRSLTFQGSGNTTVTGSITQNGTNALSLVKNDGGTLTLSGASNMTGTTTINGGTVQLGADSALGAGAVTLANTSGVSLDVNGHSQTIASLSGGGASGGNVTLGNGTLTLGNANNTTFSGNITGSGGSLVKQGTGVLTLNGTNNTYTGTTTIAAGTLQIDSANALAGGGNVRFSGGTLQYTANSSLIDLSSRIINSGSAVTLDTNGQNVVYAAGLASSNTGGLTKNGGGTLTFNAAGGYTGATTINGGTLRLGIDSALGTGAVALANTAGAALDLNGHAQTIASLSGGGASGGNVTLVGGTLTVGDANNTTFNGNITGTGGSLVKQGAGVLSLGTMGSNYTGATTINGGSIKLLVNSAMSSSSAVTLANVAGVSLDLNGKTQTLTSLAGGGTTGGNITLGAGGALTVGDSNNTTFSGAISGTGSASLVKTGAGTLILNGSSTYTGATTIQNGTVSVNSLANVGGGASAFGAPTTTANGKIAIGSAGAAGLTYTGTGSTTNRVLDLAGTTFGVTLDQSGTGLLKFTSNLTASGAGSKTLTLQGSTSGTGEIAGKIVDNSASNITSVVKAGTGTWALSFQNTYSGGTTITGGTLQFGTGNSASQSGNIDNESHLVFSSSVTFFTFSGDVSGAGDLTQNGTGTLLLTGTNTYSGGTIISSGTLQIGNGQSGSLTGDIDNESHLAFNVNSAYTFAGIISGTGDLTKKNLSTLTLTGASTYTGATIISGPISVNSLANVGGGASSLGAPTTTANGTISFGSAALPGSAGLTYIGTGSTTDRVLDLAGTTGSVVTLDQSGTGLLKFTSDLTSSGAGSKTLTLQGSTSGTGEIAGKIVNNSASNITSVVKAGTGSWTLSGANTYSGSTTVSGGTLSFTSSGNLGDASATNSLTINNGAKLQLTGNGVIDLGTTRTATLGTGGGVIDVTGTGILTLSGAVSGSSLTMTDTGTLILSNNNNYSGGTTISGGTLRIGGGGATGSVTGDISDGSHLVFDRTADYVYNGNISGSGDLTKNNTNTLTLGGTESYGGSTTINGGTLVVTSTTLDGGNAIVLGANGTLEWLTGTGTLGALTSTTGGKIDVEGGTLTLTGAISGDFTKIGAGTLSFGSSYSGNSTVSSGSVAVTSTQTGAIALNGANTSAVYGTTGTYNNAITISGTNASVQFTASGTTNFGGTITVSPNQTGTVEVGSGAIVNITGSLTKDAAVLVLQGPGTFNVNAAIVGSTPGSDLVVDGSTTNLNSANSYSGPTYIIDGGTLNANVTGAMPIDTRSNVTMDATGSGSSTLALGADQAIASLTGASSSTVNLGSHALTIGTSSGTTTYAGVISGSGGSLVKDGGSTQIITGSSNSYNGPTTVSAGVLAVNGSIASSAVTVTGGTLQGSGTVGAVIAQSGAMVSAGDTGGGVSAVGTLTASSLTLNGGSALNFEFADIYGTAGTGWDEIKLGGGLLSLGDATAANRIMINVNALESGGVTHDPGVGGGVAVSNNFDTHGSYAWLFIQSSNVNSPAMFEDDSFTRRFVFVDDTNGSGVFGTGNAFDRPLSSNGQGTFGVAYGDFGGQGTGLYITYATIPEPGSMLLAGLASLGVGWYGRRRKRQTIAANVRQTT